MFPAPPSIVAGLLAGVVTAAGIAVIRRHQDWGRRNADYAACFAAGVLVTVSFLHLIPVSLRLHSRAPIGLLVGYFALHLFNRFFAAHVCDRRLDADYELGVVALVGIGLHSFIDGIVYAVTFSVSFFTGILAAAGMVLHEFPEGVVTYLLLIRGGFEERKAVWWALAAAALTTPLGAIVSQPFVARISPEALGMLLALSAGALVYVGATHLLPHAEAQPGRFSLLALGAGVLTAVVIALSGE